MLLLAMVFIPHYLNTRVSTMPQFMERRFGAACRNFLSWYTILGTIVLWLGGTVYAGGIHGFNNLPTALGEEATQQMYDFVRRRLADTDN